MLRRYVIWIFLFLPTGVLVLASFFFPENIAWLATVIIGVPLTTLAFWAWSDKPRAERFSRGQCMECGYELKGNRSGICPECGTPISIVGDVHKRFPNEIAERLLRWHRRDGEFVMKGDPLCDVEAPKGIKKIDAWESGILRVLVEADTVMVGDVAYARIETPAPPLNS